MMTKVLIKIMVIKDNEEEDDQDNEEKDKDGMKSGGRRKRDAKQREG